LRQRVQDLETRVDQNSTNSSRPLSTDPIGVKRKPPTPPSRSDGAVRRDILAG